MRLPVPSTENEQIQIVELAIACRKYAEALGAKLVALEALKKSLLYDLLTGRVRVNDTKRVAAP